MKRRLRRSSIQVFIECLGDWIPESDVKVLDVEEDIQGRDKLTFKCPECGKQHTSLRVGRG